MRVVIAGGGIAGVECALTLAVGHPDLDVTLVYEHPSLRVLPNLVYVPFGIDPEQLDVPIAPALEPLGIRCVRGTVTQVDQGAREVYVDYGARDGAPDGAPIGWDALVLAPGTTATRVEAHHALRSLGDAVRLREALDELAATGRGAVTVLQLPDNTWPTPGYELATLLGTWREQLGLEHVDVALVTSARSPLALLGDDAARACTERLAQLGVDVVTGVPAGRVEALADGVTIDMVDLAARTVDGAPRPGVDGFYTTAPDGSIAPGVFAVGDAADLPFKSAFATSWHARRVLLALGGSLARLGEVVDGIPVDACEYQMDLGDGTLVERIAIVGRVEGAWAELLRRPDTRVRSGGPDKLRGTLTRQLLLERGGEPATPPTFEELLGARHAARAGGADR